jgi:hypothetical protein
MRLYTNNQGVWAGTQADAKKLFKVPNTPTGNFVEVDVPTTKAELMEFLNTHRCRPQSGQDLERDSVKFNDPSIAPSSPSQAPRPQRHGQSCSAKDLNQYDVHDVVLNCDKAHLGNALAAIISRLHDMQD